MLGFTGLRKENMALLQECISQDSENTDTLVPLQLKSHSGTKWNQTCTEVSSVVGLLPWASKWRNITTNVKITNAFKAFITCIPSTVLSDFYGSVVFWTVECTKPFTGLWKSSCQSLTAFKELIHQWGELDKMQNYEEQAQGVFRGLGEASTLSLR